jgi:methyltransferase
MELKNTFLIIVLFTICQRLYELTYLFYQATLGNINIDTRLFAIGAVVFFIGQTLRIVAIKTLGERWTTRIAILPKEPAIKSGLFNLIRHPNYLGVCFEIFALPLMIGEMKIAILFSTINFIILFFRIRTEENYLKKYSSYSEVFNSKRVVSL